MLWFQKKNEADQNSNQKNGIDSSAGSESAFDETNELGRKECLQHLNRVLSSRGKGTVLKLYIENFKRLNQVFGYTYCEMLLTKIIRYLQKETGYPVYRYLGVEFILYS